MKNSTKEIKQYLANGKLNEEIPINLIDGLVLSIQLFLKEGFVLTQIKEIASIGQIISNRNTLEQIKKELMDGTFEGGYSTANFDIKENYIDLVQITLDNESSYAIAYNSPGDYWGTFVGIIWFLKLKERLKIGEFPNSHIEFIK